MVGPITVTVCPTTGGQFTVELGALETVDTLKRIISKKLNVAQERITLLHRERLVLYRCSGSAEVVIWDPYPLLGSLYSAICRRCNYFFASVYLGICCVGIESHK